ncbi:Sulfide-quinone reductase, partial [uncultured Gammaproteobacteria bacterium]
MKKITIIGSGFAGLTAVRTLRKQDKTLEITLISPKAELVYMPSLIWVSSGAA